MHAPRTITLSLVSHTNAGKTTLARTLLAREVGEVRDAPHVTESAQGHEMLRSDAGDLLMLWDTPGFGDSHRLARRMRLEGHPLGWLLSQVWDRWRDRAFWSSQQALRHLRDGGDVMLYLVNAADEPSATAWLEPEMQLLAWVGKPVLVLLNQIGPPREAQLEATELQRWRECLAPYAIVRDVLPLDAFARCWVHESVLLDAVARALPPPQVPAMRRLAAAWQARREQTFQRSMRLLAQSLARVALMRQPIDEGQGWFERLQRAGGAIGLGSAAPQPVQRATQQLAHAAQGELRASTQQLLALHQLEGQAQEVILKRVAALVQLRARVDEGRAALLGGALSGALAGLKADLVSGGLTLGGGMLAGGVLGALGAAGLARSVNVLRGTAQSTLTWQRAALQAQLEDALLRYLAVAHYGRGRGAWEQGEAPAHWAALVQDVLASQEAAWQSLWARREDPEPADAAVLATALQTLLADAARQLLGRLYPAAEAAAGAKWAP